MFSLGPEKPTFQHIDDFISQVPPHLRHSTWPLFETRVLASLLPEVEKSITRLTSRVSTKRVHLARVVLRRWQAVSKVVAADDWKLPNYQLLDKQLKKVRKTLGELRDNEILLELSETFALPKTVSRRWKKEKKALLENVEKRLAKHHLEPLFKRFNKKMKSRRKDLEMLKDVSQLGSTSAYGYLEPVLAKLEEQTRHLEEQARSPEDLHQLRITIKNWRYFLTEFYGVTNLHLVKAQQVLGKLHDIDRLIDRLKETQQLENLDNGSLRRIEKRRKQLLQEFASIRKGLPYGLRPSITSFVAAS